MQYGCKEKIYGDRNLFKKLELKDCIIRVACDWFVFYLVRKDAIYCVDEWSDATKA